MVSGKPLTNREKVYIIVKKDDFSLIYIAKQLGKLYPLDNSGYRDRQSVRNYLKEWNKEQTEGLVIQTDTEVE